MSFSTADLCNRFAGNENFFVTESLFRSYGASRCFHGEIATLRCFEDNALAGQILSEKGSGKVLVIDGGGSCRCALIDSGLAVRACENGWHGVLVYGCVRDSAVLATLPMGVLALQTHPMPCHDRGGGDRDVMITVAGVNFRKGHYLYADDDGIIVSSTLLG